MLPVQYILYLFCSLKCLVGVGNRDNPRHCFNLDVSYVNLRKDELLVDDCSAENTPYPFEWYFPFESIGRLGIVEVQMVDFGCTRTPRATPPLIQITKHPIWTALFPKWGIFKYACCILYLTRITRLYSVVTTPRLMT